MLAKNLFFGALVFFFSFHLQAQDFNNIPSSIPLKGDLEPARDLVYQGAVITPTEALALVKSGKVKDLSLLNPKENDLWKDQFPLKLNSATFSLGFSDVGQAVRYRSAVTSPIGVFRFTADAINSSGRPGTYNILIGPKVHNILLRKALLQKLGYAVPEVQYLKNLTVQFDGVASRDDFVDRIKQGNKIEASRWIREDLTIPADRVTIKDALITYSNLPFIDLSAGRIPSSEIQKKRILNSILVPYAITELSESVNAIRWHVGQILNDQLVLPVEDGSTFSTTLEDAHWIYRRIGKLDRNSWKEIVSYAKYPDSVGALVLEKLISRRDQLRDSLKLSKEISPLRPDEGVTYGREVVKGKLVQTQFNDWGAQFYNDDPDSPLDNGEMKNLFKSKGISNLLGNFVRRVNTEFIPSTNLNEKIFLHQVDLAARQFAEFLTTGQVSEVPFGFWSAPYFGGNIIASRDVVAGSYLGTDNKVQLADTVGFNINTGLFALADGLPSNYSLTARGEVYLTSTFTHVKPISSIEQAVKEPLSNIIVPLLMKNTGELFDKIAHDEFNNLPAEEQQSTVTEVVKNFKDNIGIGESLIVSWVWGGQIALGVNYGFTERLRAQAGFNTARNKFSRIHILRASEDSFHIYKDPASTTSWGAWLGLNAGIQIFRVGTKTLKGAVNTSFYKLDLNLQGPTIRNDLLALQRVLVDRKTDLLDKQRPAYLVNHRFKERSYDLQLFHLRWLGLKSVDLIEVVEPSGGRADFVRASVGKRKGKNKEELGLEVVNELLKEYTEEDIVVASASTGDPGDTIFGKSQSRLLNIDARVGASVVRPDLLLQETYGQLNYKWKGWEIERADLQDIIDSINAFYGEKLFPDSTLANTTEVQLYSINLSVSMYENGIRHFNSLTTAQLDSIFNRYRRTSQWIDSDLADDEDKRPTTSEIDFRERLVSSFHRYKKKYEKEVKKGDVKEASKNLAKAISQAERLVTSKGLFELMGGPSNVRIEAQLNGFRIGDALGDKPFMSNSYGEVGADKVYGPLQHLQRKIGMTESEFFIYWLLNKI